MQTQPFAIEMAGLTKQFGRHRAVDSLNLAVRSGSVFGFLGPNGAGKTTTIRMLLGLIRPTQGGGRILGYDIERQRAAILPHVGAIVESPAFYPILSGRDNLRVFARTAGNEDARTIAKVLEKVGLSERAQDRVKTYSLGMKQRLAIAAALLNNPQIIFLDEPTNGLDPAGTVEIRELIGQLGASGHTIFLSSHLLHEVEQVCSEVAIINHGKLVAQALISPGNVNYAFPGGLLEGLAPVPIVGTFVMIVLGALLIGSEYGYDTWKNLLIRRPGRTPFILSKWLTLVAAAGAGVVALLLLGQLLGLVLDGALHLAGPAVSLSLGSVLVIILMQALVPLVAGAVAMMGAVIGRSSVAGIVIGIAWFSIDSLLGGLFPLASLSNAALFVQARLTGVAMASNGGIASVHLPGDLLGALGLIPVAIVVFYLVVPIAVAAMVFRKRDMLGVS